MAGAGSGVGAASAGDVDPEDAVDQRPRRGIGRYLAVSVGIVAVMSMIAAIGFRSALSGWSFVTAAAIGTIGASAVVLVAEWRRLLLGESVAISALAFVLLGGVAVNGVPTPGAYTSFARGLVDGWADLLSSAPPADITDQLRALPFTVAWLAAAVGGEIARHSRRPGLPAVGPILALALSLLFTIEERWLALLQGAGILAGTLVLITVGQRLGRRPTVTAIDDELDAGALSTNRSRLMLGAVVVVGAVLAAPIIGPRLPLAEANERFDLRRYQVPPFDPLAVPSPLVQVKASLKDERRDDVVFVVAGDTPIDRWPVAVMSDYDGVVWTVADPERDPDAAEFVPVDTQLPELDDPVPDGSTTVEHTVEIVDLGGSFLPAAGTPRQLTLPSDLDPRMNMLTGTVALPGGVTDGLTYQIRSAVIPDVPEDELAVAPITPVDRTEQLELLPPPVRNLAADLVEGQDRGWPQLAAIRDEFVDQGFYDVTEDTAPGHSYGRIAAMLEEPDRIVGFEEQYAAAAAVMAQVAELPVRVVVGYRVPAAVVAQRARRGHRRRHRRMGGARRRRARVDPGRRHAGPLADARSRHPGQHDRADRHPQPPAAASAAAPDRAAPPGGGGHRHRGGGRARRARVRHGHRARAVGRHRPRRGRLCRSVLLVLFALLVVGWKLVRRQRRRNRPSTTGRVAGAWAEAVDRCTESGAPRLTGTTPQETVGVVHR